MLETLTGILIIITGLYAWFTFKILKANEEPTVGDVSPIHIYFANLVPQEFYCFLKNATTTGAALDKGHTGEEKR